MKTNDAIKQLQDAVSGANAKSWAFTPAVLAVLTELENLRDQNNRLKAEVELLNGKAAEKLAALDEDRNRYKNRALEYRAQGYSAQKISDITGINVSTIKNWIYRK